MLNLLCTGIHAPQRTYQANCAVVLAFLALLVLASPAAAKTPAVSEPAPDFALKSSAGKNLRLSEFRGDVVIVNFWSTRCGRCRDQLDRLTDLNETDGTDRMRILSINVDSDSSKAQRAVADQGLEFPVLLDTNKTVTRLYDPSKLPMILIIDPHGTVRYIHNDFHSGDELLYAQELAALLAE